MKFTQIPTSTFEELQLNAGILVKTFNPATSEFSGLLGATTGGIQFHDSPTFEDFGSDIDNCPKNTLELKKLTAHEVTMSGNFVTVTPENAKRLAAAADISNTTKIVPRNDLKTSDFETFWFVGDYSDKNTGDSAGYIAIKIMNALNTGGFQLQTKDREKGQFAFNFMGHYSISAQDTVPYEMYVKTGTATVQPRIEFDDKAFTVEQSHTLELPYTVTPSNATITWTSSDTDKATVSNGVVTAKTTAGSVIITASITVSSVTYTDTCTVVIPAASA